MNYQWAAATHKGRVRTNNEDSFAPAASGRGTGPAILMVADGMGGAVGGEVASRIAVERAFTGPGLPEDRVARANQAVVERSLSDPGLAGMGTTLTLAEVGADGIVRLAHVGDSRAYLLRQGVLQQITNDHTVVAEQLAAGHITPAEAATHPQRSMLTRVLGISNQIEIDLISVDAAPGDRLLLCSDGLTGMVEDQGITELLAEGTPEEAVWALIEEANSAGGHDNITVVVVDVER